jgi:homoserine kinase
MRATVTVAATAANLGPGFDVFGLALDLVNRVTFDDAANGVAWEGEGDTELPRDGSDLVSRTVAAVAERMDVALPAFGMTGRHTIPLERGLGSSSAATVAGVIGASLLLGLGWEHDPSSVFAMAAEMEGHPDNAAPAVFGGFTIAMPDGGVHRLEPHPDLRPVVLVPPGRLGTAEARAALPERVDRADAVANIAHAALAVRAFTEEPRLLGEALQDRLHQAARIAMADVGDVGDALRAAGVPWCVSGAGPSLLAFEDGDRPPVTAETIGLDAGWTIVRPGIRRRGFEVTVEDG